MFNASIAALAFASLSPLHAAAMTVRADDPPAPAQASARDTLVIAARLGLTAERLAAAGFSAEEAAATIVRLRAHLGNSLTTIRAADMACRNASAAVQALKTPASQRMPAQQDLSQLATALQTASAAEANRDALLAAAAAAALNGIDSAKAERWTTIMHNKSRDVPTAYLVVNRTDGEWESLRDALAHLKACARFGKQPDPARALVVTNADADETVAGAKAALQSQLSVIAAMIQLVLQ